MKPMKILRSIQAMAAVLAMSATLYGQTLNTIYSFGHNKLGYKPFAGVIFGPKG